MSTCTIEDLTPQQLFQLNEQIVNLLPPELGPKASLLESLGLSKKARACEDCGTTITVHRCPDGHIWRQGNSCNQRFCDSCADKISQRYLDALHPWIEAISHSLIPGGPTHFHFIRLYSPIPREHDAIAAHSSEVGRRLRKLGASSLGRTWHRAAGFIKTESADYLVTLILYWGPETSASNLHSAFSDMRPSILTRPNSHARRFFTDLVAPVVPTNKIEQAYLEAAFTGIRQIKTLGPRLPPQESTSSTKDEDLFTEDKPPVNNSPTTTLSKAPKCPFCRKHASESLYSVPAHSVREILMELGWLAKARAPLVN